MVVNGEHAMPAARRHLKPQVNPLVQECVAPLISTAALEELGRNRGELTLTFQAALLQLAPTQGCQ